jgi:hypothetical protein
MDFQPFILSSILKQIQKMTSQKRFFPGFGLGLLVTLGLTGCVNIHLGSGGNWTIWGLLYAAVVIYTLLQVLGSSINVGSKLLWVIGIICFPFLGSIAWFFLGRR